jgi:DNA-binding CsgD family transcriptional regulator
MAKRIAAKHVPQDLKKKPAGPPATADVLRLMRLMTSVAALKTDPIAQRQTLIDGLQSLFQTKLGWFLVADNWRPNRPVVMINQVLTTDVVPLWVEYIGNFTVNHPIEADPYASHSVNSNRMIQVIRRADVLPDRAAEKRFAACVAMMDSMEIGDAAVAGYRTGPDGNRLVGFSLHRDKKAPKFTGQDYTLIRLAIEELREMQHAGHIAFRPPVDANLSPRLQQVLERILSGKSAKEIAGELSLSVHTVREHLQRLYARHGVNTREDLTSKFLR